GFDKIGSMIKQSVLLAWSVLFFGVVGLWSEGLAQVTGVDPSGYILKYDEDFDGIGPRVYFLPAPRTKKEVLTDTYQDIVSFQDSIAAALQYQKFKANFKATSNQATVQLLLDPMPITDGAWEALIHRYLTQNNRNIVYGLLNEQARQATEAGRISQGISLLKRAQEYASVATHPADIAIIQANLATLQ